MKANETVNGVVHMAVCRAVYLSVHWDVAVDGAAYAAVYGVVHWVVYDAVYWAVYDAAYWAVGRAVDDDPPHFALADFLSAADRRAP